MESPYTVLGIPDGAPQEEVRSAYLKLVKRYHPDRYMDADLKEKANQRLIAINEAYDAITRYAQTGSSVRKEEIRKESYRSSYSGQDAADLARARSFLSRNNLDAAKNSLYQMGVRNAEWYYLYGIVCLREGNPLRASEYLDRARSMEPENPEFQKASMAVRNRLANEKKQGRKKKKGFFQRLFGR